MQLNHPSRTLVTLSPVTIATAVALTVFALTSSRAAETVAAKTDTEPAEEIEYPMRHLSNGVLDMKLYTPDAETGFYRGTRFDWSGIIERVEYEGHRYYGPWRSPHNPTGNDFVSGPAEEFAMADPMGYDEAGPGESFPVGVWGERQRALYRDGGCT